MDPKTTSSQSDTTEGAGAADPAAAMQHPLGRRAAVMATIDASRLNNLNAELESGGAAPISRADDTIAAAGGDDTAAGAGADSIEGGGNDSIPGADTVAGDGGDTVAGNTGADSIPGAAAADDMAGRTFRIKVDGQDRIVSHDELVRAYTLHSGAEARFKAASEALRTASDLQERLARGEATPPDDPSKTAAAPKGDEPVNFEEIATVLSYGEPKDVAEALKKLTTAAKANGPGDGHPTQVDEDALIKKMRVGLAFDQASERFKADPKAGGYADLLADPILADFTRSTLQQVVSLAMQESKDTGKPAPTFWQMFDYAGKLVRTKIEKYAQDKGYKKADTPPANGEAAEPPQNGAPAVTVTTGRRDAKRSSPQLSSGRAPPPAPASGAAEAQQDPETAAAAKRSDVIQGMRRARHQA